VPRPSIQLVRLVRLVLLAALTALGGCGDNEPPRELPYFTWGGETTVGAMSMDHLDTTMDFPLLSRLDRAVADDAVVMIYGHIPGRGLRLDVVEDVLAAARDRHLPFLTFADLAAGGPRRAGICLSFDDDAVDEWMQLRDLFARYDARATFFVTRYREFGPRRRQLLHQLADDGNDIEAHGVNHLNARDFVDAYGIDQFINDEVQPSLDVLRADGFAPVAYAHPFGAHTPEINAELLTRVDGLQLIRSISVTPLPPGLTTLADGTPAHPPHHHGR
jgi:hypothetical protein